ELLAAMLPPERLMVPEPAVAVMVPPPPQEPLKPLGVETTKPAASGSLKATPVRAVVVLLFWRVNCNDGHALCARLAAPQALMISGGATTVMEAVDGVLVPPSFELTNTVLFFTVAVVPWTSTETVQLAFDANVPPDRLTDPAPPTAVAVPPHVLLRLGVEA